jgi:hypothetical protein
MVDSGVFIELWLKCEFDDFSGTQLFFSFFEDCFAQFLSARSTGACIIEFFFCFFSFVSRQKKTKVEG